MAQVFRKATREKCLASSQGRAPPCAKRRGSLLPRGGRAWVLESVKLTGRQLLKNKPKNPGQLDAVAAKEAAVALAEVFDNSTLTLWQRAQPLQKIL